MTVLDLYERTVREIEGSTGRDHRKLANNTYGTLGCASQITIRLHNTDIAVIDRDRAVYNTGGWSTVTTKDRINRWMPQGFKIASEKGVWYVWQYPGWNKVSRFYDGITLRDSDNGVVWVVRPQLDDPDEPLRKALDRYVKLYTDERLAELVKHAVEDNANGDCWYCKFMGPDEPDHLLTHIAEGNTMATLAHNAVKASGYKPEVYLGMFRPEYVTSRAHGHNFYGDVIRRSIRKYLKARVLNRGLSLPDLEESYA